MHILCDILQDSSLKKKSVKFHYQDKTLKDKYAYQVARMKDGLGMLFLALALKWSHLLAYSAQASRKPAELSDRDESRATKQN